MAVTRRIPPVRRLLMNAKLLIQEPENWIKGAFARSAKGRKVNIQSPKACRFCAYGAMLHLDGSVGAYQLLNELTHEGLIAFNDAPDTTHPMIMRLFDKAIRRAKEQGI